MHSSVLPDVRQGTLILEHGGLAYAEQRARAIQMGIPLAVQHPLLYSLAAASSEPGIDRTRQVFLLRQWIEEGALLGAGSDCPVGSYDAMASIWGMVTRQTKAGIMAPESAIDLITAVRSYTADAARLISEDDRIGRLQPENMQILWAFEAIRLRCWSMRSTLCARY